MLPMVAYFSIPNTSIFELIKQDVCIQIQDVENPSFIGKLKIIKIMKKNKKKTKKNKPEKKKTKTIKNSKQNKKLTKNNKQRTV